MSTPVPEEEIGIIMLAAGSGRRFGSDKRQARLETGKTLLETTLTTVPSCLNRRILVLRPGDEKLAENIDSSWKICIAPDPDSGMAGSLATGIEAAREWKGALIALADMPYITANTFETLQKALTTHAIVVPLFQSQRGNPVAFRNAYFQEIGSLSGDRGARGLLEKYEADCLFLETGDEGVIQDIDTPDKIN